MPSAFFEVRIHNDLKPVGLTGLCAGYELGRWRRSQLAAHMMEWLPDFALNYSEQLALTSETAVALLARAAAVVYTSEKYRRRGELGELLLHVALRKVFSTIPAISKFYFKDSANDTVKGFDAVHVIANADTLELWLGESKFYEEIGPAIKDAVQSIKDHLDREYLREEFIAIVNKLDPQWPHAERLKLLLDRNNSLDKIFSSVCIPVFLTYNSPTVSGHTEVNEAYKAAFVAEATTHYETFRNSMLPARLVFHLFLLPLENKQDLQSDFDRRLKAWQSTLG